MFDGNPQQTFKLRVMVFCTFNAFPTYGNLSGYSVKGHQACPICEKRNKLHPTKTWKENNVY